MFLDGSRPEIAIRTLDSMRGAERGNLLRKKIQEGPWGPCFERRLTPGMVDKSDSLRVICKFLRTDPAARGA